MRCYKVKVKSEFNGTQTEGVSSRYVACEGSVLYVMGESFSCVEEIVHYKCIESIERVGIGYYVAE